MQRGSPATELCSCSPSQKVRCRKPLQPPRRCPYPAAFDPCAGSPPSGHPSTLGSSNVIASGDKYLVMADVSQFEPQDIMVATYNYCIVIQAEKVSQAGLRERNEGYKLQLQTSASVPTGFN